MKYKYQFFIIIQFLLNNILISQSNLILYSSVNISSVEYTLNNYVDDSDTTYKKGNNFLLPNIGIDIGFKLSELLDISTGLGVSILGVKNYNDFNIPDGINIDKNLKLNYIRLPIEFKYQIMDNIGILCGYSISYCYRKNINFFEAEVGSPVAYNIFHEIYQSINIGLFTTFNELFISANFQPGLNRIWDTKEFNTDYRAYLKLNSFSIKIGYLLNN